MTTLVTGGAGFVGLNVVEALIARGDQVVVLDRLDLPPTLTRGAGLAIEVRDIRDADSVCRVFRDHSVKRVIHAAVITADATREARDPATIIDVNLGGTLNVITAARDAGCERLVYVGSGAAYGSTHAEGVPIYEDVSPSRPEDVYGISKFAAEQVALRLGALWGLDVVSVRLGSVLGPWEFDSGVRDLLSPQLQVARMAVRGQHAIIAPTELWRDWVYSRDVAAGLLALLAADAPKHRVYHLSSGVDWRGSFTGFCQALSVNYPKFAWRIAAAGETPNVSFRVAADRSPMDVQRMASDIGFRAAFVRQRAYADYIAWIHDHEDFFRTGTPT